MLSNMKKMVRSQDTQIFYTFILEYCFILAYTYYASLLLRQNIQRNLSNKMEQQSKL